MLEKARGFVDTRITAAKDNLNDVISTVTDKGPASGILGVIPGFPSALGERMADRRAGARRTMTGR